MKKYFICISVVVMLLLVGVFFFPFPKRSYRDSKVAKQISLLNAINHYINDYKERNNEYPQDLSVLFEFSPELKKHKKEFGKELALWRYTPELENGILIFIKNGFPHPDIVLSGSGKIKKIWKPDTFP